jgi:hypothetical protein
VIPRGRGPGPLAFDAAHWLGGGAADDPDVAVAELDGERGVGDQHGDGLVHVDPAEGNLLPAADRAVIARFTLDARTRRPSRYSPSRWNIRCCAARYRLAASRQDRPVPGTPRRSRKTSGLVAGLQDAKLGAGGREVGDEPARVIMVRSHTGMTSAMRVSVPIAPICVTCASSGLVTAAAHIDGEGRGRQRVAGTPCNRPVGVGPHDRAATGGLAMLTQRTFERSGVADHLALQTAARDAADALC